MFKKIFFTQRANMSQEKMYKKKKANKYWRKMFVMAVGIVSLTGGLVDNCSASAQSKLRSGVILNAGITSTRLDSIKSSGLATMPVRSEVASSTKLIDVVEDRGLREWLWECFEDGGKYGSDHINITHEKANSINDLTVADLETMDWLVVDTRNTDYEPIKSLDGLQYCKNLTYVNFGNSGFYQSKQQLEKLPEDSFDFLANNTKLEFLSISGQYNLTDISFASSLANLKYVRFLLDRITDFTPLETSIKNGLTDYGGTSFFVGKNQKISILSDKYTDHNIFKLPDGSTPKLSPTKNITNFYYQDYNIPKTVASGATGILNQDSSVTWSDFSNNSGYLVESLKEAPFEIIYYVPYETVTGYPVTVHYVDEAGTKISSDVVLNGNVGEAYKTEQKNIFGYTFDKVTGNTTGTYTKDPQEVTYVYKKNDTPNPTPTDTAQPVTVHYVDESGHKITADEVLTGKLGEAYTTEQKTISGYTFDRVNGNTKGTFTKDAQEVTYIYQKNNTPNPNPVVKKGTVVYALKKIGLYSQKNFSNKTRKVWYHQKSRINRPMFVVKGYATSNKGHLRYLVKDVNHHSKTAGKTGYITVNRNYTLPIYYAETQRKITVINPQGINAYRNAKLSGKSVHYKQGTRLTIKKIVKHHLTTRFILSNGRYITANKKLVISGTYKMPTKVQAKDALNRYNDGNLRHKNRHYAAKRHQTFKVLGWDYSNADNFNRGDSLRYRVAGGYITANKHLVKTVR